MTDKVGYRVGLDPVDLGDDEDVKQVVQQIVNVNRIPQEKCADPPSAALPARSCPPAAARSAARPPAGPHIRARTNSPPPSSMVSASPLDAGPCPAA